MKFKGFYKNLNNLSKNFITFFLFFIFFCGFLVFLNFNKVYADYLDAKVSYNNEYYSAYIFKNISYVDTQTLALILESPVYWDPTEKALIVSNIKIFTKVVIYKGKLLVALRDVLIPLGYDIKWNQVDRVITIYKPNYKVNNNKANVKVESSFNDFKATNFKESDKGNKNSKDSKKYEIPFIGNDDNKQNGKDTKEVNKKPTEIPPTVFIPRTASNEEFKVTVSDLKESKLVKGLYSPQVGFKFVILTVSQQNLSNKVQLYTGKFVLYDDKGYKYDYIEGLSSYILQVLLPSGMNFGTLVFEIPEGNVPSKLVLETYGSSPIVVNLL